MQTEPTKREQRTIMLEAQTPAYARSDKVRRAIDLQYQRANNLRRAFRQAGIDVPVSTRALVPMTHTLVSGLNVPGNIRTFVGRDAIKAFNKAQRLAKQRLEMRNYG